MALKRLMGNEAEDQAAKEIAISNVIFIHLKYSVNQNWTLKYLKYSIVID